MTAVATPETTNDAFLGGQIMVRQPRAGYRAGIDAVFLAAAAPCEPGVACRVLDIGAGVGTVGLCVAARWRDASVTLLEREPELAALARANVADNGLDGRAAVLEAAVGDTSLQLAAVGLVPDSFDHVLANPPYHAHGRGTAAADPLKAVSHAMPEAGLEDWVRFMARMVRPGGSATIVHKAEALDAILAAMTGRFGGVAVLPLHPRSGAPASRILVQGIKGSRAPLSILAGIMLHGDGNAFTPAAAGVLRDGVGVQMR